MHVKGNTEQQLSHEAEYAKRDTGHYPRESGKCRRSYGGNRPRTTHTEFYTRSQSTGGLICLFFTFFKYQFSIILGDQRIDYIQVYWVSYATIIGPAEIIARPKSRFSIVVFQCFVPLCPTQTNVRGGLAARIVPIMYTIWRVVQ